MKSLLNKNYDIVDHILNSDLEKLASIVESVSEKAKTGYIPSYEEQMDMPQNNFALVLWDSKLGYLNKYANYTPELTELNLLYLVNKMDTFPEEIVKVAATNLTCSAKQFHVDIPEELKQYESDYFIDRVVSVDDIDQVKYAQKMTPNEEIKKYALNGKYPIHTPEHIKKAEFWFENNYPNLSIDEVLEFTTNITKEAKEQGVQLEKTAAEFSKLSIDKFNPDLYNHIQVRKSSLREDMEDYRETYNDILRNADELGTVKVAFLIELLDKESGLDNYYGRSIIDPIRTTFAIEKKAGLSFEDRIISPDDLNALPSNSLMEIVGDKDVISGLKGSEALVVFESLPTPIKRDIAELINV